MPLAFTSRTYHLIAHLELDRFATEHYGRPYSVVAALEATNGTDYAVQASTDHRAWEQPHGQDGAQLVTRPGPDPDEQQAIEDWRAGQASEPHPSAVLSDLADRGLVPAGEFLISVSW